MEKIIKLDPAYDLRDPDPSKNYGIHGVNLIMLLKGSRGAVQFVIYTNWMLPHVAKELDARTLKEAKQGKLTEISIWCTYHPQPADLGYHSPVPIYEGQNVCSESCEYLDGKPCYYDGSGLNAERIYEVLLKEGSDGVWRELEDFYINVFGSDTDGEGVIERERPNPSPSRSLDYRISRSGLISLLKSWLLWLHFI